LGCKRPSERLLWLGVSVYRSDRHRYICCVNPKPVP
jgi:hypothetical protein